MLNYASALKKCTRYNYVVPLEKCTRYNLFFEGDAVEEAVGDRDHVQGEECSCHQPSDDGDRHRSSHLRSLG